MAKLTPQEIAEQAPPGWVLVPRALRTRLRTGSFTAGLKLANAIGVAAEQADHHPDLDLRYTYLDVGLTSHDVGAVTGRDLRMAARISELASAAGVAVESAGVVCLEMGLDSPAFRAVLPFWSAVLGLDSRPVERVRGLPEDENEWRDPAGVLPTIWFQESGSEEPRQRWHPDLWVDPAEVQPRIDAALAAGGRLVSDESAPRFWVLSDPEGNLMCLCTWQTRDTM